MANDYKTCDGSHKSELGRMMVEVMAVLAIIGILSVGGIWMFNSSNQERQINEIVHDMNIQVSQIYPAIEQNGSFSSKEEYNKFLSSFTKRSGEYILSFQADPNSDEKDFITQITTANGDPIKGKMCRALISKMSKLKMAQDVSFSLKDEEMDNGTVQDVLVPLNGHIVDSNAICGG